MPDFIIATQHCRVGQTIDAVMCDPTVTVYPDRRSEVPVKATIYERSLLIDNEPRPRAIISCVGENGTTTYIIDGSTSALRNRERAHRSDEGFVDTKPTERCSRAPHRK